MPYWQLFYHIVWATKGREPLLTDTIEPMAHELMRTKAIGLGATVLALNGVSDHVHLVAAIPPRIALANFIGQLKGVSATRINKSGNTLFWQAEYGVFSCDRACLPKYIAYVERQKEHHAAGTTIALLERIPNAG